MRMGLPQENDESDGLMMTPNPMMPTYRPCMQNFQMNFYEW